MWVQDALKEFRELLERNCLRRTKEDVALMLPGKNDRASSRVATQWRAMRWCHAL